MSLKPQDHLKTRSGVNGASYSRHDQSPCYVIQRGEHLSYAGEHHHHAYLLRSGCVISYVSFEDGKEEIVGLHRPGDILGAEALLGLKAPYSLRAADTANIQLIHFSRQQLEHCNELKEVKLAFQALHAEVLRLTEMLHIDRLPTEQRLARFISDFSTRQQEPVKEPLSIRLPISRRQLASHLGLAAETLSRSFTSLEKRGLIRTENHDISILDPAELRRFSLR
ncbi:MAG: Crp/Fnr family transcriptional regulator [Wenzhouxiangella sp.]|nr:Crp/Fnr family transcriptional regulator [Wenzhouxiangella sp.]